MAANSTGSQPFLQNLRAMFYLVTPQESMYEKMEDVPNFVDNAIPYFLSMVAIEAVIQRFRGRESTRVNDSLNSMTHGLLSGLMKLLLMRSIENVIYVWIYENYKLVNLPWDSTFTWIVAFLCMDFGYYWFHRLSHESNIVWASHQVHHSSEDYNLSTALRQSAMQKYYSMFCYFPMALFLPPTAFYTHQQFNLLYQFWIHTEVVNSIGPLEYVLNSPSHHRVHHGRNPYCIDKNYAGTLIIWDRMFGTFQAEKEKVVYGLVHPNQFWDPIYGQFFHYLYIFGLVNKYDSVSDKMSAVVKGPGWLPGTPWRGNSEDLPEVEQPVRKYDSSVPLWASAYIVTHFMLVIALYSLLAENNQSLTFTTSLAGVCFIIFSFTSFGALFDHKRWGSAVEAIRCGMVVTYIFLHQTPDVASPLTLVLTLVFTTSAVLWATLTLLQYKLHVVTKKVD